eukprot:tig00020999_g16972.t1
MRSRSSFPHPDSDRALHANGRGPARYQPHGEHAEELPVTQRAPGETEQGLLDATEQASSLTSTFGIIEKLSKQISRMMKEHNMSDGDISSGPTSGRDLRISAEIGQSSPEAVRPLIGKDLPGARPRPRSPDEASELRPTSSSSSFPSSKPGPAPFTSAVPPPLASAPAPIRAESPTKPIDFSVLAMPSPGKPLASSGSSVEAAVTPSPRASLRRSRGSSVAQSVPEMRGISHGLPDDKEEDRFDDDDGDDREHVDVNGIRVSVDELPKRSPNLRKGSLTAQRAMLGQSMGSPSRAWRSPPPTARSPTSSARSHSGSSHQAGNDVADRLIAEGERYRAKVEILREKLNPKNSKTLGEVQMTQLTSRLLGSARSKESHLEKQRKQRDEEEVKELKPTPSINPRSRRMAEHHNSLREEIVRSTAERMDRLRREREERELCELRPAPMISARSKQMARTAKDWQRWDEERKQKIERARAEKEAKEAAPLVFKPSLNYRSRLIASRGQEIQELPVEDRLLADYHIKQQKRQQRLEEQKARERFTPEINEHSKNLQRADSAPIHERLYIMGLEKRAAASGGQLSPRRQTQSASSTPRGVPTPSQLAYPRPQPAGPAAASSSSSVQATPAPQHLEGPPPLEDPYPIPEEGGTVNELRVDADMLELLASIGQPLAPAAAHGAHQYHTPLHR